MEKDKIEDDKVSWNFSADHSKLVFNQLQEVQKYKMEGSMGEAFTALRELFDLIEFSINEKVVEKMDKRISIVARRKKYWDINTDITKEKRKLTREEYIERENFVYGVRKLTRMLLRLLKGSGYLPSKPDETNVDM